MQKHTVFSKTRGKSTRKLKTHFKDPKPQVTFYRQHYLMTLSENHHRILVEGYSVTLGAASSGEMAPGGVSEGQLAPGEEPDQERFTLDMQHLAAVI